jgi:hypothetical protein
MGREVRRVPKDWQHPRDAAGKYIPMLQHFLLTDDEVIEGLRKGWLHGEPPYYGEQVMPEWPASERTHYQMYECTSEGTPISPVMETPEELARWLADTGASAFGDMTASYGAWLATIREGGVVSAIIRPGVGIDSGVAEAGRRARAERGQP